MSQPPTPSYEWTYSEYARFPDDGNRYEVIDGEVLLTPAPSPRHQRVAFLFAMELHKYVNKHGLGEVLPDVDLLFVTGQFLRPDLLVVPANARQGVTDRGVEVPPLLIVEVLSPTSRSIDLVKKPRRYGDFGVPDYWVVDIPHRRVRVFRDPDPTATDPERAYRVDLIFEGDAAITTLTQPAATTTANAVLPPAGF